MTGEQKEQMKINSWRELETHANIIGRQIGSMINKHETFCY
jgi:hypothetical protein